jgi:hypothetical protein
LKSNRFCIYYLSNQLFHLKPRENFSIENNGDKTVSPFNIVHAFKANWIYELPFGKNQWQGSNAGAVLDRVIGGWSFHGAARIQSGAPFNIGNVQLVGLTRSDLQKQVKIRQGLVVSAVQPAKVILDEIIGIINIDDQGIEDSPVIEVFGASGLLHRLPVGNIPAFSCRHFLLSELLKTDSLSGTLSLRLVAQKATLLMSVIHLDYERRDLAMDHGSDRFSTYLDYSCQ